MDTIDFPDANGSYTKRLVKQLVGSLTFFFLVSIGMGFRMAFNGECNIFEGFGITFLFVSPFTLLFILITIYKCRYYITKITCTTNLIDIWFYEFGKRRHISLEIDNTEVIIKRLMMSRIENYVLVFKYNNRLIAQQDTYDDWSIDVFKRVNEQLLAVHGLKLNSVLNSAPNKLSVLNAFAIACGALAVFYCSITLTVLKRSFNYYDYLFVLFLISIVLILVVKDRKGKREI